MASIDPEPFPENVNVGLFASAKDSLFSAFAEFEDFAEFALLDDEEEVQPANPVSATRPAKPVTTTEVAATEIDLPPVKEPVTPGTWKPPLRTVTSHPCSGDGGRST
jgi:hypothetical protein